MIESIFTIHVIELQTQALTKYKHLLLGIILCYQFVNADGNLYFWLSQRFVIIFSICFSDTTELEDYLFCDKIFVYFSQHRKNMNYFFICTLTQRIMYVKTHLYNYTLTHTHTHTHTHLHTHLHTHTHTSNSI